jgi:hypothetical protein
LWPRAAAAAKIERSAFPMAGGPAGAGRAASCAFVAPL